MSDAERFAAAVTRHSRVALALVLVATLVVGSAAGDVESGLSIAEFASDSTEAEKLNYVESNFSTEDATTVQVVFRGGDALSRESLLAELRLQRALVGNGTVNATLRDDQPFVGLSNLVATALIRSSGSPDRPPTLPEQEEALASASGEEVERTLERLLDPDRDRDGPEDPYALLPTTYEPGSTDADARVMLVFQAADGSEDLPAPVVDAQLAVDSLAGQYAAGDAFAFGAGIVDDEATRATGDSFGVIAPFAFLLVLVVLSMAYRDPLDVLLGLAGVVLVLVWMGGFMGWVGIGVTNIIIAVPFLLIGLSIDYALHVVMRYREAREDGPDENATGGRTPREAMRVGLGGVVVALAATTFTTAVGFLSNLVSPLASIREFGLVAAAGIVSTFVVFAVLLPALKVELEGLLARLGLARDRGAFGRGGLANRALGLGATAARRAPVAVVAVALVLAAGGGVAATDIETSLAQEDFLPRDSPAWMDSLPGGLAPGDYQVRERAGYLDDTFLQSSDRARVEILIEGDVTDPATLERLADARERLGEASTARTLADGEPSVRDPLSVLRSVAARDESVAEVLAETDTDDDGVPDRDLARVYDALYEAAPERAAAVIHREDGDYRALRLQVGVRGGADTATITAEMRAVAAAIEADGPLTATATGSPIVDEVVQAGLLETLVETFLVTLGVILAFLSAVSWRRYGAPSFGAVIMVPVVSALAWVLGAMYLLGLPFNTETAVITSIAIGLGVDYAIHVGERFLEEAEEAPLEAALSRTVAGTGGALLASCVTTASGFGVLALALVPSLQRFGLVTGTTIVFAFVASVVVLPSLLTLWWRYRGEAALGA